MYYRVAWRAKDTAIWQWKSTSLASRRAAYDVLNLYGAIPHERLRVFAGTSRDTLDALLALQNAGRDEVSVTSERFLRGHSIRLETVTEWEARSAETTWQNWCPLPRPPMVISHPAASQGLSAGADSRLTIGHAMDRRRLDVELGPGGDHDEPYTFAASAAGPLLLTWTRLLARVQRGELAS